MNEFDTADIEGTELTDRDVRALTDYLLVDERAPGVFDVYGEDGDRYTVDAESDACTCPDAQYRHPDGGCKHARRVAYHTGARTVPAWVDRDTVDPLLVDQLTDPTPRVATDGGEIIVAGDDGEILDEDEDDEESESHRAVPPYDHDPRGLYTDANYDDNFQAGRGRE